MPLRVLHVISAVAARYGGTTLTVLPLTRALCDLGIAPEIAATDADGPGRRLFPDSLPRELQIQLFPCSWPERWYRSPKMRGWLADNVSRYDLVHIHGVWAYSTYAAARAASKARVPYIVCPQGMLTPYSWSQKRFKKQLYWNLIERRTILESAAFHVTSAIEANEIRKLRRNAVPYVIPHGVEETAFTLRPEPASLRTLCGSKADRLPIVLFLSRLHPKKGIVDRLLPAISAVRTPHFLVVVGGEDCSAVGYKREIELTIRRLGLENQVLLADAVNGDLRWALFDGAALFVLPSHSENFGIVVAEAMARSCPVVVTREVQSAPLVKQGNAGIVVDGDTYSIATAIDDLLTNPKRRESAGVRGHEYASSNLQWSHIARQVSSMYFDVLSQTNPK